jgi:hypothetical protein
MFNVGACQLISRQTREKNEQRLKTMLFLNKKPADAWEELN